MYTKIEVTSGGLGGVPPTLLFSKEYYSFRNNILCNVWGLTGPHILIRGVLRSNTPSPAGVPACYIPAPEAIEQGSRRDVPLGVSPSSKA